MSARWTPSQANESNKLAAKEGDWRLAGSSPQATRTRHGGTGRPSRLSQIENPSSSDSSASYKFVDEDETSSDEESLEPEVEAKKPKATRVIIESKSLKSLESVFQCPKCNSAIDIDLKTCCIATKVEVKCCSTECGFKFTDEPEKTSVHAEKEDNIERMTDYALNVLYVTGIMACGDGGTEAARLLGLLGLPNDTTMEARSFHIIEGRIGPFIRQLAEDIMAENVREEVRLNGTAPSDFDRWQLAVANLEAIPVDDYPRVNGSFDAAWQQKKSGHSYDSPSGHGLIFGQETRKALACVVKSKLCNFCASFKKKNPGVGVVVPDHDCCRNHAGSSGSMEAASCLELLISLFSNQKIVLRKLCCDDDSSVRADSKWSNADYLKNNNTDVLPKVPISKGPRKGQLQDRPDKGKLPGNIPESDFVSDPNHRGKLVTGELIQLDTSKADINQTMTSMDSTCLGNNFKSMARTLKDKTL